MYYKHKNKDEVLEDIYARKNLLRSRYVSGATQFFGLGAFASVHPKLMTNKYDRQHYLEKLCEGRKLKNQEVEAMLWGDIPCFFKGLTDQSVYDEQKVAVHNFFHFTILEEMERRMHELSAADCMLQEKVIAYSSKVFNKDCELEKKYREETVNDEAGIEFNGIKCAKNIADYILTNSIIQQDKIFWLGLEEENGTIKIKPVDIYFYNGIAGIAVFFQKMYQICGQYKNICMRLKKMLFSYTDRICRKEIYPITEYTGMYCGEGSVVYAYQLLYQITGECKYKKYAEKHAKILFQYIGQDTSFDLLYGNAGAVLILCRQYIDSHNETYLVEAQKALVYLDNKRIESKQGVTWLKQVTGNPVCSIAHGNSGMLFAYACMEFLIHDSVWEKRMKQIMAYEDQYYEETYGNWIDLRKEKNRWETYAWCNGGVGVIYARIWAKKYGSSIFDKIDISDKVERLLKNIIIGDEMCLCHGNMGNLLVLYKIANIMDSSETIIWHLNKIRNVLFGFHKNFIRWKKSLNMGFMNGIAGIGIGWLILEEKCYHNLID